MSLLATYPGLLQALAHEMTPKFLATRSAASVPNVVPCTSTMPAGDAEEHARDRLIFGNFLLRKSVDNLGEDPRVGILVITTDLEGWMLQGGASLNCQNFMTPVIETGSSGEGESSRIFGMIHCIPRRQRRSRDSCSVPCNSSRQSWGS